MPSLTRAIAKALATLAGPAGFPVEFAVSLYDDEQTEKRIAGLLAKIAEKQDVNRKALEQIFNLKDLPEIVNNQLVIGFQGVLNILRENQEQVKLLLQRKKDNASVEKMTNVINRVVEERKRDIVEAGLMTEQILITELMELFTTVNSFLALVEPAGFPRGEVAESVPARQAYYEFVLNCRGLAVKQNLDIFTALSGAKPGSRVLKAWVAFHEVLSREPSGHDEERGEQEETEFGSHEVSESQRDTRLGKRCLTKEEAGSMVGIAVAPKVFYPICTYPPATHAAGAAIARLAVRAFWGMVAYVQNQFDTRGREMILEDERMKETLEEYLCHLNSPKAILVHMTGVRSASTGWQPQNLLTKTLGELAGGKALCQGIMDVRGTLEDKIIKDMNTLYREISRKEEEMSRQKQEREQKERRISPKQQVVFRKEKEREQWEKDIGSLLKEKGNELLSLRDKCAEILENAISFKESLKEDWDLDVKQLWDRKSCESKVKRKCPIPF